MSFYPKKLKNASDLEREKKRLLKKRRQLAQGELSSLSGILGKAGKKDTAKSGESSWIDILSGALPLIRLVVKGLLRRRKEKKDNKTKTEVKQNATSSAEEKPDRNKVQAIAIEFIGGYLKWKAIELTYKGVRHYIRKDRDGKNGNNKK
jgi:hypothetical protein